MTSSINFKPNNLDIIIALISAILMPLLCSFLYQLTGALIPMLIYYILFCIIIVKWRKKTLEYKIPKNWAISYFLLIFTIFTVKNIIFVILIIPVNGLLIDIILTVLIWAPINAFMEQLIWIYVFDTFALRFGEDGTKRYIGITLGFIFCSTLVALIHILYWSKFLMHLEQIFPIYQIYIILNIFVTIGYITIYKKTQSMFPPAILHIITDITIVIAAGYSIIPYLIVI